MAIVLTIYIAMPSVRHCVHPRVPQMAVVCYAESAASIYPYEMMAKWVAHLLDGAVHLPSVVAMEESVVEWERWGHGPSTAAALSSSSHALPLSQRGTAISCAGTWGAIPGGSGEGPSPNGCSYTGPRTMLTSSDPVNRGEPACQVIISIVHDSSSSVHNNEVAIQTYNSSIIRKSICALHSAV